MTTVSFSIKSGCFAGDNGDLSILLYKISISLFVIGIVATALSFYITSVLYFAGDSGDCSVLLQER